MEPVSVTIAVIVGGLIGAVAARRVARRPAPVNDTELQIKVKEQEQEIEYINARLYSAQEDLKRMARDRARYKEIAATHDIKLPDPGEAKIVERKVWSGRKYNGHPRDNIAAIEADLAEYDGMDVVLELTMEATGGWAEHLGSVFYNQDRYGNKHPIKKVGGYTYEGPPDRVLHLIYTMLTDDDTGMVRVVDVTTPKPEDSHRFAGYIDRVYLTREGKGKPKDKAEIRKRTKLWKDGDSPIHMTVKLTVREVVEPPPLPEIHRVEVLHVEEKVVDRIIEKPVIIKIPEGYEAELTGHTPEEIQAMLDLEAELKAMSHTTADEELRKRRQAAIKKQTL